MLSTEVISAALSKETPVQASLSMSQELRGLIGMGTLGMDKLHAPRITSATREDNKASAKGWKVQSLNKSVDSILASAERLKAEVEHETIFWGQVLAISDNHWAVCRLPYDKHTLGVRFGFSEGRLLQMAVEMIYNSLIKHSFCGFQGSKSRRLETKRRWDNNSGSRLR
jgi:mediator of RNA polymerase II transcription subunit 17